MSDRLDKEYSVGDSRIQDYLGRIADEYERVYYSGIVFERRGKAILSRGGVGAFEMLRRAMDCFEKAEAMRPAGNDDAILRWNGCARIIVRNDLAPREMGQDFLE
jgi:hypothetical protein